jgi:hypothetical protein
LHWGNPTVQPAGGTHRQLNKQEAEGVGGKAPLAKKAFFLLLIFRNGFHAAGVGYLPPAGVGSEIVMASSALNNANGSLHTKQERLKRVTELQSSALVIMLDTVRRCAEIEAEMLTSPSEHTHAQLEQRQSLLDAQAAGAGVGPRLKRVLVLQKIAALPSNSSAHLQYANEEMERMQDEPRDAEAGIDLEQVEVLSMAGGIGQELLQRIISATYVLKEGSVEITTMAASGAPEESKSNRYTAVLKRVETEVEATEQAGKSLHILWASLKAKQLSKERHALGQRIDQLESELSSMYGALQAVESTACTSGLATDYGGIHSHGLAAEEYRMLQDAFNGHFNAGTEGQSLLAEPEPVPMGLGRLCTALLVLLRAVASVRAQEHSMMGSKLLVVTQKPTEKTEDRTEDRTGDSTGKAGMLGSETGTASTAEEWSGPHVDPALVQAVRVMGSAVEEAEVLVGHATKELMAAQEEFALLLREKRAQDAVNAKKMRALSGGMAHTVVEQGRALQKQRGAFGEGSEASTMVGGQGMLVADARAVGGPTGDPNWRPWGYDETGERELLIKKKTQEMRPCSMTSGGQRQRMRQQRLQQQKRKERQTAVVARELEDRARAQQVGGNGGVVAAKRVPKEATQVVMGADKAAALEQALRAKQEQYKKVAAQQQLLQPRERIHRGGGVVSERSEEVNSDAESASDEGDSDVSMKDSASQQLSGPSVIGDNWSTKSNYDGEMASVDGIDRRLSIDSLRSGGTDDMGFHFEMEVEVGGDQSRPPLVLITELGPSPTEKKKGQQKMRKQRIDDGMETPSAHLRSTFNSFEDGVLTPKVGEDDDGRYTPALSEVNSLSTQEAEEQKQRQQHQQHEYKRRLSDRLEQLEQQQQQGNADGDNRSSASEMEEDDEDGLKEVRVEGARPKRRTFFAPTVTTARSGSGGGSGGGSGSSDGTFDTVAAKYGEAEYDEEDEFNFSMEEDSTADQSAAPPVSTPVVSPAPAASIQSTIVVPGLHVEVEADEYPSLLRRLSVNSLGFVLPECETFTAATTGADLSTAEEESRRQLLASKQKEHQQPPRHQQKHKHKHKQQNPGMEQRMQHLGAEMEVDFGVEVAAVADPSVGVAEGMLGVSTDPKVPAWDENWSIDPAAALRQKIVVDAVVPPAVERIDADVAATRKAQRIRRASAAEQHHRMRHYNLQRTENITRTDMEAEKDSTSKRDATLPPMRVALLLLSSPPGLGKGKNKHGEGNSETLGKDSKSVKEQRARGFERLLQKTLSIVARPEFIPEYDRAAAALAMDSAAGQAVDEATKLALGMSNGSNKTAGVGDLMTGAIALPPLARCNRKLVFRVFRCEEGQLPTRAQQLEYDAFIVAGAPFGGYDHDPQHHKQHQGHHHGHHHNHHQHHKHSHHKHHHHHTHSPHHDKDHRRMRQNAQQRSAEAAAATQIQANARGRAARSTHEHRHKHSGHHHHHHKHHTHHHHHRNNQHNHHYEHHSKHHHQHQHHKQQKFQRRMAEKAAATQIQATARGKAARMDRQRRERHQQYHQEQQHLRYSRVIYCLAELHRCGRRVVALGHGHIALAAAVGAPIKSNKGGLGATSTTTMSSAARSAQTTASNDDDCGTEQLTGVHDVCWFGNSVFTGSTKAEPKVAPAVSRIPILLAGAEQVVGLPSNACISPSGDGFQLLLGGTELVLGMVDTSRALSLQCHFEVWPSMLDSFLGYRAHSTSSEHTWAATKLQAVERGRVVRQEHQEKHHEHYTHHTHHKHHQKRHHKKHHKHHQKKHHKGILGLEEEQLAAANVLLAATVVRFLHLPSPVPPPQPSSSSSLTVSTPLQPVPSTLDYPLIEPIAMALRPRMVAEDENTDEELEADEEAAEVEARAQDQSRAHAELVGTEVALKQQRQAARRDARIGEEWKAVESALHSVVKARLRGGQFPLSSTASTVFHSSHSALVVRPMVVAAYGTQLDRQSHGLQPICRWWGTAVGSGKLQQDAKKLLQTRDQAGSGALDDADAYLYFDQQYHTQLQQMKAERRLQRKQQRCEEDAVPPPDEVRGAAAAAAATREGPRHMRRRGSLLQMAGKFDVAQQLADQALEKENEQRVEKRRRVRVQKDRSIALSGGASSQSAPHHPDNEEVDEEEVAAAPVRLTGTPATMAQVARDAVKTQAARDAAKAQGLEQAVDTECDRRRRWRRMQRSRGARRRAREREEWTQRQEDLLDAKSQAAAAPTRATTSSSSGGMASRVGSGGAELVQFCCRRTADGVWVVCGPEQLHELVVAKEEHNDEFAPSATTASVALALGKNAGGTLSDRGAQPLVDVVQGVEVENLSLEELQSAPLRFPLRFVRGLDGRVCKENDAGDTGLRIRVAVSSHASTTVSANAVARKIEGSGDGDGDLQKRVSRLPTLNDTLAAMLSAEAVIDSASAVDDDGIIFTDASDGPDGVKFIDTDIVNTTTSVPALQHHRQGVFLDLYLNDADEDGAADWWKEEAEHHGYGEDWDDLSRVRKGAAIDLVIAVQGHGDVLEQTRTGTQDHPGHYTTHTAHSRGARALPRVYISSNSPALLREIRQLAPDWVLIYRVEEAIVAREIVVPTKGAGTAMAMARETAVSVPVSLLDDSGGMQDVPQSNTGGPDYDAYEGLALSSAIPCLSFQQWQALQRNQQRQQQPSQHNQDDPRFVESEAQLVGDALRSLTRWLASVVNFADGVCLDKAVLLSPATAVSVGAAAFDLSLRSRMTAAMAGPVSDAAAAAVALAAVPANTRKAFAADGAAATTRGPACDGVSGAADGEIGDLHTLARAKAACPQWLVDCLRIAGLAVFVRGLGEPTPAAPTSTTAYPTPAPTPRPTASSATNGMAAAAATARAAAARVSTDANSSLPPPVSTPGNIDYNATAGGEVWADLADLFSRCPRAEYELLLSIGVDAVVSGRPGHALAARLRMWEVEAEAVVAEVGDRFRRQRLEEREVRARAREEKEMERARQEQARAKSEAWERVRCRNGTGTNTGLAMSTPRPTPSVAANATAASAAAAAAANNILSGAAAMLTEIREDGTGSSRISPASRNSAVAAINSCTAPASANASKTVQRRPQQPQCQKKPNASSRTHLRKLRIVPAAKAGTNDEATTGPSAPELASTGLALGGVCTQAHTIKKRKATGWRGRERERMGAGQLKRCFPVPLSSNQHADGKTTSATTYSSPTPISALHAPTLPKYSRPHTHSSHSRHTRLRMSTAGVNTVRASTAEYSPRTGTYASINSAAPLSAMGTATDAMASNTRAKARLEFPRPHSYAARQLPAVGAPGGTKTVMLAKQQVAPSDAFLGYWGSGRRTETYTNGVQRVQGYSAEHARRTELAQDI